MSYAILSNNGGWDHDMIGVVGVLDSLHSNPLPGLLEFIRNHLGEDLTTYQVSRNTDKIKSSFEDEEFSLFADGETVLMVRVETANQYSANQYSSDEFYYLQDFS